MTGILSGSEIVTNVTKALVLGGLAHSTQDRPGNGTAYDEQIKITPHPHFTKPYLSIGIRGIRGIRGIMARNLIDL